jgi:gluconolactonase
MKRIAGGYGLLEAARWYSGWGLVFSDMTGGGVFRLSSVSSAPTPVIRHRKGIGGLVKHDQGGFVVAGRNVAHKAEDGTTTVLLETRDDEQFFNDLTADGHGRIYVGSVAIDPLDPDGSARLGRLYCIGLDRAVTVLSEDVVTSNGLGTDPVGSSLYHVDTGRRVVWQFPLSSTGAERSVFVDTSDYDGEPDGLAVASDGSVWVAMAGGGVVVAWDPQGRRVAELPVPQPLVTSVCFGRPSLTTLFVLTGATSDRPDADGGCIYVSEVTVPGLPGPIARVALAAG